jgi:ATP-dependent DNA helicase RecG
MEKGTKTEYQQPGLTTPVKYLKGIGEVRARLFAKLGVQTVLDLMEFFPRAYIQRRMNTPMASFKVGQQVAFTAQICWVDKRLTQKNQPQLNCGISDGQSAMICTWFRFQPWQEEQLKPGLIAWFSGLVSEYQNMLQIIHPEFEILDEEDASDHNQDSDADFWKSRPVLPVYPLAGNLTQKQIRKAVLQVFSQYAAQIEENLPAAIIQKHHFEPRKAALQMLHFTTKPDTIEKVKQRFVYEEFFYQQLMWARHNRYHQEEVKGLCFENKKNLTRKLYDQLPYRLTGAQKRVLKEIFADMTSDQQMSRLLQGDVGSGKTIVTLLAMLLAIENGYQAAIMAPTEILAEQHYQNFIKLLGAESPEKLLPDSLSAIRIVYLRGGQYKGKKEIKEQIRDGSVQLIIGTHALLQEDVVFANLGFIAIDEQHRFGVEQRAKLARKHSHPDLLYLSATPIPRSLAMSVFGDLQVSILDELPPSRKPVSTFIRHENKLDIVYQEIRRELDKGRQVYIVCPLIDESEKLDLLSAETLYKHISTKVFPQFKTELLHGRMRATEKDAIMLRFKAGEIRILVSTTVIEVGVDVPNATVMMIEHAERFGLSQLHQLRGRVGRGADQAYCFLIEHFPISAVGRERLAAMTGTTDGFVIAEKDLELRGPGEFFGTEQAGLPRFRFASLLRDQHILRLARNDAFDLVYKDFDFTAPEHEQVRRQFYQFFAKRESLMQY